MLTEQTREKCKHIKLKTKCFAQNTSVNDIELYYSLN